MPKANRKDKQIHPPKKNVKRDRWIDTYWLYWVCILYPYVFLLNIQQYHPKSKHISNSRPPINQPHARNQERKRRSQKQQRKSSRKKNDKITKKSKAYGDKRKSKKRTKCALRESTEVHKKTNNKWTINIVCVIRWLALQIDRSGLLWRRNPITKINEIRSSLNWEGNKQQ